MRAFINCARIALAFILLGQTAWGQDPRPPAPASNQPRSFDEFYKDISDEIEQGLNGQIVNKTAKYTRTTAQSTHFESPWTMQLDSSLEAQKSDPRYKNSVPSNFNLSFLNRNGWEFNMNSDLWQHDPANLTHIIPVQGSVTIGRDIHKGGSRSPKNIQAEIDRTNAQTDYINAESKLLNLTEQAAILAAQYFNLHCRLSDLDGVKAEFAKIMHAAQVKLDAKSLATKDFLILQDTSLQLERQYQDILSKRVMLLAQFSNIGPRAMESAKRLTAAGAVCTDLSAIQFKKETKTQAELDELTRDLPATRSLEKQRKAQFKQIEFLRMDEKYSFVPYIGVNVYSDQPGHYSRDVGVVGFKFVYNFEGNDKVLQIRSAQEKLTSLADQSRQSILDSSRDLGVLYATVAKAADYLTAVQALIENSKKLMRVFDLQLKLGLIDPVATSQAYVSYANSLVDARDAWEAATNAEFQIKEVYKSRARVSYGLRNGFD